MNGRSTYCFNEATGSIHQDLLVLEDAFVSLAGFRAISAHEDELKRRMLVALLKGSPS